VEVIARETNQCAHKFSENMPNLKIKSRTHHWKEMNRIGIMKLLAFFLLQGLHQKLDNMSYFCQRFHLLLKFLHFVDNNSYDVATCGSKRLYKLKPILDHLNAIFRSVHTTECDVSVDESLMMWNMPD
jgi:hypothetical protein